MDKIDKAVKELNHYLDTFYTDAEGWMELADISSCHQSHSLHKRLHHMYIRMNSSPFFEMVVTLLSLSKD